MGCGEVEIKASEVQHHMKRVYSKALQNTLDLSYFFISTGYDIYLVAVCLIRIRSRSKVQLNCSSN